MEAGNKRNPPVVSGLRDVERPAGGLRMAKEELVASLQNAVIRGEPLERAVQTLISAGYPPADVQDSARYVDMGIIGKLSPQVSELRPSSSDATNAQQKTKKGASIWQVAILVVILLILATVAVFMFFGNSIMSALFGK